MNGKKKQRWDKNFKYRFSIIGEISGESTGLNDILNGAVGMRAGRRYKEARSTADRRGDHAMCLKARTELSAHYWNRPSSADSRRSPMTIQPARIALHLPIKAIVSASAAVMRADSVFLQSRVISPVLASERPSRRRTVIDVASARAS